MIAVLSKSTKMVLIFLFHFPAPLRNELPDEHVFHSQRASKDENCSELFQIQFEGISFLRAFVFVQNVNSRKLLARSGYPYYYRIQVSYILFKRYLYSWQHP